MECIIVTRKETLLRLSISVLVSLFISTFCIFHQVSAFVGLPHRQNLLSTSTISFTTVPSTNYYYHQHYDKNHRVLYTTEATVKNIEDPNILDSDKNDVINKSRAQTVQTKQSPPTTKSDATSSTKNHDITEKDDDSNDKVKIPTFTSLVLKVAYDGEYFYGWSAANDGALINNNKNNNNYNNNISKKTSQPKRRQQRSRSRRNRNKPPYTNRVRSVQGILRDNFAKLYGNVDPLLVQVEGCSRTDKGVHSSGMICLVYCLSSTSSTTQQHKQEEKKGKGGQRMSLPFESDLDKIVYRMNKMLPPDVRIVDASPTPERGNDGDNNNDGNNDERQEFHPSLDATSKTYRYMFAVGDIHDPMRSRNIWYIPNYHAKSLDIKKMQNCAQVMIGTHNFTAFRGAFHGNDRQRIQTDTTCTISNIIIEESSNSDGSSSPTRTSSSFLSQTYCVSVTGDRFLYKMMRFLIGTMIECGKVSVGHEEDDLSMIVQDMLDSGVWMDNDGNEDNLMLSSADEEQDDKKDDHDDDVILKDASIPRRSRICRVCAPAHGLTLEKVDYGPEFHFSWISQS